MSAVKPVLKGLIIAVSMGALAACTTVNLGPEYNPPVIKTPGAPSPSADAQPVPGPGGGAQPMPIPFERIEPLEEYDPTNPDEYNITLTARLSPYNVIPPVPSDATGRIDALYDRNTRLLRWKASWSDLSSDIVSVQFYGPADIGQTGPATMTWPGPFGARYEGRATLTPDQEVAMVRGKWYVGVSTTAYPHGELRGQLETVR